MNIRKISLRSLVIVFLLFLLCACVKPKECINHIDNDNDNVCDLCGDNISIVMPVADKTVNHTSVVTYDGPKIMTSSNVMSVKVENKELFVYDTLVNHTRKFSFAPSDTSKNQVVIFDFEGSVNIEIEIKEATELFNVVVRPLAKNVKPTVNGNKITFKLDYTDNYVVEYGVNQNKNASRNALHLFANPIEKNPIDENNVPDNTIYVGPGVWNAGALPVSGDNVTLYLAGGAVVYGQIMTANVKNLTICGRGIISGELFDRTKESEFTLPIELQRCSNVTIKDITILDPAGWAVTLYNCSDVEIDNLKIITARGNGDGISVQSCNNVLVKGGFVRTWDDSLVVKNVDKMSTNNITFDGVYVWTDLAQSMEVGFETYGEEITNVTFKNITVFHNFHKAAMSIHNADNANISKVVYKNITIEDAQMLGDNQLDGENDFLIDITIQFDTNWSKSGALRGTVKDITFENIKVLNIADSIICRVFGEGIQSNVDKVTIKDIEIEGQKIKSLEELRLVPGAYTSNVVYLNQDDVYGAIKELPYKLEIANDDKATIETKENIMQDGLQVPAYALFNNEPSYAGVKLNSSKINVSATMGSGDRANSNWNLSNVNQERDGVNNLIDNNRTTEWKFNNWTGADKEFVALSFEFESPVRIGDIRFLGSVDSDIVRYYSISIFAKTTIDGQWSRIRVVEDLVLTPQNSNYVDWLINAKEYYGIQLRVFYNKDVMHPENIVIGEIEFYPPSLTTGKSVESSEYEDVYKVGNMLDGSTLTYFESKKGLFPAYLTVNMGEISTVKYINIHLPPLLTWGARTQDIEIQGSFDGITFFNVVEKTKYTFDSANGNMVSIVLDDATQMKFIKLVYTANSSGYGAQISELFVYGE